MKIYFKTGQVMEDVPSDIVKVLCNNMTKTNSPQFQSFSDNDGNILFHINVSEILYIR